SAVLSQKVGTSVEKSVVFVDLLPFGTSSFLVNVPSIVSLFEEIDFTCPASTCFRKYGLNGTFTRGSPDRCVIATDSRFSASSTAAKTQKPRSGCGGGGLCSSGMPRPSGAGETRQRCLSCGIGGGGTALLGSGSVELNRPPRGTACPSRPRTSPARPRGRC